MNATEQKNIIQLRVYGRHAEKADLITICGFSNMHDMGKELNNLCEINPCFKAWYSEFRKRGVQRVPKTLAKFFIHHVMGEDFEIKFSTIETISKSV